MIALRLDSADFNISDVSLYIHPNDYLFINNPVEYVTNISKR
ncbi:hypothetical protein SAMN04488244_101246 [Vibrio hangzhouensis]|uniref:Uncharacterized protein n=1 Tax=Vibrio hangzhouensis TaxID=462991 RepID=A0A1H5S744_9VIBR|nr:hypothetical protein SAMN04488244_101246 [Vibrio hangzhouensis]